MTSQPHPEASSQPSRVCRETVSRAVDALLKWIRSRGKKKASQLFSPDGSEADQEEDLLYLVLTLKKIPHAGRATDAYRIPLPHPLSSSSDSGYSICLLVDDRPKSPLSPAAARAALADLALPFPAHVLSLSDLRRDYAPFDARRALAAAHDLFLADRRVAPLLPGLLGKHFHRKKGKLPVPIDLGRRSWPDQLRQVCGSTLLHLRGGTCSAVTVGRASQGRERLVENVIAAAEAAVGHVPRKWRNVRSLHLKAAESLALPVYQAVAEPGGLEIGGPGVQKKERKAAGTSLHGDHDEERDGEDELDVQKEIKMAAEEDGDGDGGFNKRKSDGGKTKDRRNVKRIKRGSSSTWQ